MDVLQYIFVGLTVLAAAAFVARSIHRGLRGRSRCACGCHDCPATQDRSSAEASCPAKDAQGQHPQPRGNP